MFDSSGENSSSSSAPECFMTSFNTKRKKLNKKRFSDDQVRSLETMFETESKLETKKKLQLASELGLQPRQVAIWFQNKRARWKSKQLERDYSLLRSDYDNLASQFESLKKDKHSLLVQLQKLNDLIDKSEKEGQEASDADEPGVVSSIDNGAAGNAENCTELIDVQPSMYFERSEYGLVSNVLVLSDDDDENIRTNPDYLGLEEGATEQVFNIAEPADSSLTSAEEWGRCLDSDALLEDQPSSGNQWWDFWS
ncbi:hypothetical protein ACH5RR_024229 [Cinchona calisaya]|uniref:Homeobox-leucine zipper protein n=1 Tax=Cinchona calisaya TaxID=153742 RepID=A0ABD2ZFZ3_9GENT